jgi:hypothetical protein
LCYHLGSENEEGEKDVTSKNEFTYIPAAEDKALCYVLEFDVFPPMPGDMYVIKVDGLYEGNQKIDLKEFQFSGSNTIKNTYF